MEETACDRHKTGKGIEARRKVGMGGCKLIEAGLAIAIAQRIIQNT